MWAEFPDIYSILACPLVRPFRSVLTPLPLSTAWETDFPGDGTMSCRVWSQRITSRIEKRPTLPDDEPGAKISGADCRAEDHLEPLHMRVHVTQMVALNFFP